MNQNTFQTELVQLGACFEAREWVGDRSTTEAWAECSEPSWMLWYAGKRRIGQSILARVSGAILRLVKEKAPQSGEGSMPVLQGKNPRNYGDVSAMVSSVLDMDVSLSGVSMAAMAAELADSAIVANNAEAQEICAIIRREIFI